MPTLSPPLSAPAAALVQQPMLFRSFCGMLGRAAYANAWCDDDLTSLNLRLDERPNDDPSLRRWFVAEQMLLALQTNIIRAGFRRNPPTDVPHTEAKEISGAAEYRPRFMRDLNDQSDEIEDLDPLDDPSICLIHRSFWWDPKNQSTANVNLSYFQIPAAAIYCLSPQGNYEPIASAEDLESVSNDYLGPVFIVEPFRALRSMFFYKKMPDSQWFERFRSYQNRVLDELVAASWRFIAVSKLEDKRGCKEVLMAAMRRYLRDQGLPDGQGISGKLLEVVASKILRQWRAGDSSSLVLLNSTPEKAKRARTLKF